VEIVVERQREVARRRRDRLAGPDRQAVRTHLLRPRPERDRTFRRAGFRAELAEKTPDAGIAEVRRRLEADGNVTVDQRTTDKYVGVIGRSSSQARRDGESDPEPARGLLVADQCEHLVREFLGYKEDYVGKATVDDHCLDALRYAYMGVAG
jgi:hypothetical protein